MTHTLCNSLLLRLGRTYEPFLLNSAKVMGYPSQDYVALYGKSEGILQMQLKSLISWFLINLKEYYSGWAWSNEMIPLKKNKTLEGPWNQRLTLLVTLSSDGLKNMSGQKLCRHKEMNSANNPREFLGRSFSNQFSRWEGTPVNTMILGLWDWTENLVKLCSDFWPVET